MYEDDYWIRNLKAIKFMEELDKLGELCKRTKS